ncbi:hypothetical protein JHW43_001470 [Diplocarpon mali]|nr:hypothetical protein JHW43_001470 [Diplocarpon mali]
MSPRDTSSLETGPASAPREHRSPSPSHLQNQELELELEPKPGRNLKEGDLGHGDAGELSPSPDVASLGAEVEAGTVTEAASKLGIARIATRNELEERSGDGYEKEDENMGVLGEPEPRLPVLDDGGEPGRGNHDRGLANMEIPDSEADTEEAVSPVKSDVVGLGAGGEDQDQDSRMEEQSGGRVAVDGDPKVQDEDSAGGGVEAEEARSTKPELESTTKASGATQDPIPEAAHDEVVVRQSKESAMEDTAAANAVIRDSVTLPFIDDGSIAIFSAFATSNLQLQTQATQATEQDGIVDSHFADAVAVMSDIGAGSSTQGIASSTEIDVGDQTATKQIPAEDVVQLAEIPATSEESSACMVDAVHDLEIPASSAEESVADERDGSVVETCLDAEHVVISEEGVTNKEKVECSSSESRDQSGDIEMLPLTLQGTLFAASEQDPHGQTSSENVQEPAHFEVFPRSLLNPTPTASKPNDSPEVPCSDNEADATTDVEMIVESVLDIPSPASTACRSIPDSDGEGDRFSDIASSQKETTSSSNPPTVNFSTLEAAPTRKHDSPLSQTISSLSKSKLSPMQPPPTRSPNTHSKTPSLSASPHTSPPVPKATLPNPSSPNPQSKSSKDILITELKAIKTASILARNASLAAEIATKRAAVLEVTAQLTNPAHETVKRHIKLLHDYNDIRDVGQGLVGMIADNRGVRIGELYGEFGVGLKD